MLSSRHSVQAVPGSQRVRVEIDGRVVADSDRPVLVYETGLPVRYYLPPEDVAMDLLQPSGTHTYCPYKGRASYWSYPDSGGRVRPDVAWAYPDPLPEIALMKGHLCFYDSAAAITVG